MAKPFLSLIIPAHNESERLPLTLIEADKHLRVAPYSYEILVVNDGSDDNTAEIVGKMAKIIRNLKPIDNEENKGKGAAVRQGMLIARGKVRVFMDADHPVHVSQIDRILEIFSPGKESCDVAVGSRRHKESERRGSPAPLARRLTEYAGAALIGKLILTKRISDVYCGFKVFSDEAAELVFTKAVTPGWGFDAEILALAQRMGMRVKEIPIAWSHDGSKVMPAVAYLRILRDAVKIAWRLRVDAYGIRK